MELTALIGRILFSAMFVTSGIAHLRKRAYMGEYARSMGVPAAGAAVVTSGLMILTGGLMVALGAWADLGALLILLFLASTLFTMHAYWRIEDAQMRQMQQIQFNKNVSMAGGALALMAWFGCADGATWALTDPLFL